MSYNNTPNSNTNNLTMNELEIEIKGLESALKEQLDSNNTSFSLVRYKKVWSYKTKLEENLKNYKMELSLLKEFI